MMLLSTALLFFITADYFYKMDFWIFLLFAICITYYYYLYKSPIYI